MTLRCQHFGGAHAPALEVCGVGAANGSGLNAHQSWAYWRADVTPLSESPFTCPNGRRATMAHMLTLPRRSFGASRMVKMLEIALRDLAPTLARLSSYRTSVLLGVAERFEEDAFRGQRATLLNGVTDALAAHCPKASIRLVPRGHASLAFLVLEAAHSLELGQTDAVLVGGVDTYYDPEVVDVLIRQERLHDGDGDLDRLIPGEGAALLLLCRRDVARAADLEALATIESAATNEEPASMFTEIPCTGRGLSDAMRAVTRQLKKERRQLHWLFSDATNESYRTHELLLALPRSVAGGGLDTGGKDFFPLDADDFRYDFVREGFGDMGAASMPTAAVVAIESMLRGAPDKPDCLVTGSSTGKDRGVVYFTKHGSEPR